LKAADKLAADISFRGILGRQTHLVKMSYSRDFQKNPSAKHPCLVPRVRLSRLFVYMASWKKTQRADWSSSLIWRRMARMARANIIMTLHPLAIMRLQK